MRGIHFPAAASLSFSSLVFSLLVPSDRFYPDHRLSRRTFMSGLPDVGDTQQIVYWIIGAAIAMFAEYLYMLPTEVRYVWPQVFTKQVYRLKVFMIIRYTGMLAQAFNIYMSVRIVTGTHASLTACKALYSYQATSLALVNATVNVSVMKRIYYLFNKENLVSICFIIIGTVSAASMAVSAGLTFPDAQLSKSCLIEEAHPGALVYMATNFGINVVLQLFSVWRIVYNPYGDDELAKTLRRDINICGAVLGVVLLLMSLCSIGVIRSVQVTNAGHSWLFFILWWMSGRLELHVQRYMSKRRQEQEGQEGPPVELDTVIEFQDDRSMFSSSRPASVAASCRVSTESTEATETNTPDSARPSVAVPPKAVLRSDVN